MSLDPHVSLEEAEALRRDSVFRLALDDLDQLAIRFDAIAKQAIPPDLFLSIVSTPYPAHPAFEQWRPDSVSFAVKVVVGDFFVLTSPSARLRYYGDGRFLNLFLDLSRQITQLMRAVRPDLHEGLLGGPELDQRDIDSFEGQFWPLIGLMQLDQPNTGKCERIRWAATELGRVPFHELDFERWQQRSNYQGELPSPAANITWFNSNVFELTVPVLKGFVTDMRNRYLNAIAQSSETSPASRRAIKKLIGGEYLEENRAEKRNKFIYELWQKGLLSKEIEVLVEGAFGETLSERRYGMIAKEYAETNGLPFDKRKPGCPKKNRSRTLRMTSQSLQISCGHKAGQCLVWPTSSRIPT